MSDDPSSSPALELRSVSKTFGEAVALDDVSLTIERGETLALVGGSGSGKTTLLRLLNRMLEPSAGEVLRGGRRLGELDPIELRRQTGYVQQEGGLIPHWTVEHNVALVPELLGWSTRTRRTRAHELLDAVGLEPGVYAERYPNALSGGQRQRVAFARALAADPEVVLLDEPFGAVDAITRAQLHRLFGELRRRFAPTSVLVTHDVSEAVALGDRIAVLADGGLDQVGSAEDLLEHPATPNVRELFELGSRDRKRNRSL